MKIIIETILNADSMKLVNTAISITNTHSVEVTQKLRHRIHSLNLHECYDCGQGGSHVWLSCITTQQRILLITE